MSTPRFKMTISLNTLEHLGIGLYSNVPAVLSELVANAWDADATKVEIRIDRAGPAIEVRDNGHGMSPDDVNDKFLTVGYKRRTYHAKTLGGRDAMGRKGIGKLAAFSIADSVEVHTADGNSASAFRMDTDKIREAASSSKPGAYFPDVLTPMVSDDSRGTLIRLTRLRKKLVSTETHLPRRLARRFSVIGPSTDFEVFVDGKPITTADRDYFKSMEFIWHFGEQADDWDFTDAPSGDDAGIVPATVVLNSADEDPVRHALRGFIGTVAKPRNLDSISNAIVLSARGRLIHEDMLPEYRQARVYTEYVVGEVAADFLDDDEHDIVTSGRQRVQQDDPRYLAVTETVQKALTMIRDEWTKKRNARGAQRALDYPSVRTWYDRMGPDKQRTAQRLFGKIEALRLADAAAKYELYRASILAFEKLALKEMLSALDKVETQSDFELLARLMSGIDEIEATRYRGIVKGRLKVIQKLRHLLPDALEKALQRHLFDHLWLLHPSWERATERRMEETVQAEFAKIDAGLDDDERRGRIDIRFQTVPGRHVIVELKRYNRRVSADDLLKQLRKYRDALRKHLVHRYPEQPQTIECVAVVGSTPTPADDPDTNRRVLDAIGARYVTYDDLMVQAEASYKEYLAAKERTSDLGELLQQLARDFELAR